MFLLANCSIVGIHVLTMLQGTIHVHVNINYVWILSDNGIIILQDEYYKCVVDYETADADENYFVLLETGFDDYIQTHSLFTVENLKAIAMLRYCLSLLANFLHVHCQDGLKNTLPKYWRKVIDFICVKLSLNKGKLLAEYFVKYIVRKHGIETFNVLKKSYPWIVPDHLKSKEEKVTLYICM